MGIRPLSEPITISPDLSSKMANVGFVSALLVVLIHCYQESVPGTVFWWFTEIVGGGAWGTGGLVRCAVPYFFLASGFFLAGRFGESGWWKRAVGSRIRSLIVPYFIWSVVACLPFGLKLMLSEKGLPDADWWLRCFGIRIYGLPFLQQLWFLKALFVLVFVSPLLRCLANVPGLTVLFAFCGIVETGILPMSGEWYSFFGNTLSAEGAFYFTLGLYLRWNPVALPRGRGAIVASGVLTLFLLVAYGSADLGGNAGGALALKWLAIPPSLIFLWLVVPCRRFSAGLVSMSFPVFLLHMLFSMHLRLHLVTTGCGGDSTVMFLCLILVYAFSFGGAVLATTVLRRFTPRFSRIAFGGR